MPLVPSFPDFVNRKKKVCAPSNVHIQEAAAMVQHSPCSNAAGQRGCRVEEASWIVWFCPYYKTTVLNEAPSITLSFPSPRNNTIQKILQSCFERYLLRQLSLSAFQPKSSPKSLWTQASGSGVRGLEGLLWKSSARKAKGPFKWSKRLLSVVLLLATSQLWEKPSEIITHILLVEARGTSSRATKTPTWAAEVTNKVVFCTKKVLSLFSPPLMSWAYCWPWSI